VRCVQAFEEGRGAVKAAEEASGTASAAFKRQMFLKDVPLFRKLNELDR